MSNPRATTGKEGYSILEGRIRANSNESNAALLIIVETNSSVCEKHPNRKVASEPGG